MGDIFDSIGETSTEPAKGDIFDKVSPSPTPQANGDIFDKVSDTPAVQPPTPPQSPTDMLHAMATQTVKQPEAAAPEPPQTPESPTNDIWATPAMRAQIQKPYRELGQTQDGTLVTGNQAYPGNYVRNKDGDYQRFDEKQNSLAGPVIRAEDYETAPSIQSAENPSGQMTTAPAGSHEMGFIQAQSNAFRNATIGASRDIYKGLGGSGLDGSSDVYPNDSTRSTTVARAVGGSVPMVAASIVNPYLGAVVGGAQGVGGALVESKEAGYSGGQTATLAAERGIFNAVLGLIPGGKAAGAGVKGFFEAAAKAYGINVGQSVFENHLKDDIGIKTNSDGHPLNESDFEALKKSAMSGDNIAQSLLMGGIHSVTTKLQGDAGREPYAKPQLPSDVLAEAAKSQSPAPTIAPPAANDEKATPKPTDQSAPAVKPEADPLVGRLAKKYPDLKGNELHALAAEMIKAKPDVAKEAPDEKGIRTPVEERPIPSVNADRAAGGAVAKPVGEVVGDKGPQARPESRNVDQVRTGEGRVGNGKPPLFNPDETKSITKNMRLSPEFIEQESKLSSRELNDRANKIGDQIDAMWHAGKNISDIDKENLQNLAGFYGNASERAGARERQESQRDVQVTGPAGQNAPTRDAGQDTVQRDTQDGSGKPAESAASRAGDAGGREGQAPGTSGEVAREDAGGVKTFRTAKGSEYTVNGDSTTRNKSLHPEHGAADVGLKEQSEKTYYLAPDEAQALGMHGTLNGRKTVIEKDGKLYPVAWNEQANKWGVSPDQKGGYGFSNKPEVGKSPVELWKGKDGEQGRQYGEWHAGNPITEITNQTTSPGSPDEQALSSKVRPETPGAVGDKLPGVSEQQGAGRTSPQDKTPSATPSGKKVEEGEIAPGKLAFTEKDQGDLSRVKEQFGTKPNGYLYVDPVVAVRGDDGLKIIDGHHRTKYAEDAGIPKVRYRAIPEELYKSLKNQGYDNNDISAGVHNAANDTEAESHAIHQFGTALIENPFERSNAVAGKIQDYYESFNNSSPAKSGAEPTSPAYQKAKTILDNPNASEGSKRAAGKIVEVEKQRLADMTAKDDPSPESSPSRTPEEQAIAKKNAGTKSGNLLSQGDGYASGKEHGMGGTDRPTMLQERTAPPKKPPINATATAAPAPEPSPTPKPTYTDRGGFIKQDVEPTVRAAAAGIRDSWKSIQKTFAPQTQSVDARRGSEAMRDTLGQIARNAEQARDSLAKASAIFDKMPLEENYAFKDRMQAGKKQPTRELQDIATRMRVLLDMKRNQVQSLGEGKLKEFDENYFPQAWKTRDTGEPLSNMISRSPLEGKKSFLKAKTFETDAAGRAAGYEPLYPNPVDAVIHKAGEMDRYIQMHKMVQEFKTNGLAKFRGVFDKADPDRRAPSDPAFQVNGPPTLEIKEAFDKSVRDGLESFAQKMGINHERKASIGGVGRWGFATEGTPNIVTKFGGENSILAHEIGHQLDFKYGLSDYLKAHDNAGIIDGELTKLAQARNLPSSKSDYAQSRPEKMASIVQAYVSAPQLLEELAPKTKTAFDQFINETPAVHGLRDIKPGLEMGIGSSQIAHGGILKQGEYTVPNELADVIDNHLKPGLRGNALFNGYMGVANVLNQVQLAGAFHAGFTSADSMISKGALGLEQLANGKPIEAAKSLAQTPIAPVTNAVYGHQLIREYKSPGTYPHLSAVVDALTKGGARVGMDDAYHTRAVEGMVKSFRTGNIVGGVIRTPFAALDAISRPIMNYLVPMQKWGVMGDLMHEEMQRLGTGATSDQIRAAGRKVVDSVDNRMGQVAYDNLFMNRKAKDALMGVTRSVGWNLGTFRELGGGAVDAVKSGAELIANNKFDLSHRTAYVASLLTMTAAAGALYQYMKTGQYPQELKDFYYPKTGRKDAEGNDLRIQFPTYMKDVGAIVHGVDMQHPGKIISNAVDAASNKTAPLLQAIFSLIKNRDYYGTQITDPDATIGTKLADRAKFLASEAQPFSIQNVEKNAETNAPLDEQAGNFVGLTPAPKRFTESPAHELAGQILQDQFGGGSITREQRNRFTLRNQIISQARSGDRSGADKKMMDAVGSGSLTTADREYYQKELAEKDSFAGRIAKIQSPSKLVVVYEAMTPDERKKYGGQVETKIRNSRSLTNNEKSELRNRIKASP